LIADIKAGAERRAEARYNREMELERIRRSQCAVPLLWIGCPAKARS
jgi:hypothetical protein